MPLGIAVVSKIDHVASVILLNFFSLSKELERLSFPEESVEEQNVLVRISIDDFNI